MRKLIFSLLSIFSITASAQDLSEFSTSMDFEEFEVVTKHLQELDVSLGNEISASIAQFKESTALGKRQRFGLKNAPGYMLLEREDDYAFTIAIFTSDDIQKKIADAYEKATEELGI